MERVALKRDSLLVQVARCAGLILALTACAYGAELKNAHVAAEFGPHGLMRIEELNAPAGPPQDLQRLGVDLTADRWSMEIDHDLLKSTDAEPRMEQVNESEIDYRYRISGYEVEVKYRLMPEWWFVSKQVRLVTAPRDAFVVRQVTAVDIEVKEAVEDVYVPSSYLPQLSKTVEQTRASTPTRDFGAFLRLKGGTGVMLTVQNPYLDVDHPGNGAKASYAPEMEWKRAWGAFETDVACLGLYRQSGKKLAREMRLEWQELASVEGAGSDGLGMDRAEIEAFTECVRAFLIHPQTEPSSVEVGWTLNDYQIDVGTEEGKTEYKRIIDTAAELGIHHLLYAPGNSKLADRKQSADTWSWEYVLWLNLGQKIRKGEWDPAKDEVPADVAEMVAYAKGKHVGLLAYVYPSVPYEKNRSWLVHGRGGEAPFLYATLSSREFQDYLLRNLVEFQKRTGITGYSFDYAFLNEPGSSSYAQWFGWRRVVEGLRRAVPEIVIDGRQSYQQYGPWSWLAGTYPHPTGTDEQPESFRPFPDLHFDRVSADRTRFVNYWYRNYQFAPSEVIPGYATHQTERSRNVESGGKIEEKTVYTRFRPRDWDYLGFRYSFLSSMATGGWNNVVDMIPARDEEEWKHFSAEDKRWIREWLEWTVAHKELLRHTRTILDQPGIGNVDGTAAVAGDRGFLFVFNPNYAEKSAEIRLDKGIGLTEEKEFLVRELYPQKGRLVGKAGAGTWSSGDVVRLKLDGTSATVLEIVPASEAPKLAVFNAPVETNEAQSKLMATVEGGRMKVTGVAGELGEAGEIGVLAPGGLKVETMTVNGHTVPFTQKGRYVEARVRFAGQAFHQAQQVRLAAGKDGGKDGSVEGMFTVPGQVVKQLEARKKAWPIPWTTEDYETTWLAPGRLLLFVQFAEGMDTMRPVAMLDGQPLELKAAYSSTRVHPASFVGFYADLSQVTADREHRLALQLTGEAKSKLLGVFFDNVEPQFTEEIAP